MIVKALKGMGHTLLIYDREHRVHASTSMRFHKIVIGVVHKLKMNGPITYHIL